MRANEGSRDRPARDRAVEATSEQVTELSSVRTIVRSNDRTTKRYRDPTFARSQLRATSVGWSKETSIEVYNDRTKRQRAIEISSDWAIE